MKLTSHLTAALLLVFLISGCTARYIPNRLNVPLLQEKNEFRTTVNPRNLQLSYSPLQGLGIMANGFYMDQSVWRTYTDEDKERARQLISLAEVGAGYYRPISADSAWRFEIYTGYGTGKIQVQVEERYSTRWFGYSDYKTVLNVNTRQHRFFVQPTIGFGSRYLEAAFSTRVSALAFSDVRFSTSTPYHINYYGFEELSSRKYLIAEPALTLRAGPKYLKFETQVGYTSPINYLSGYTGRQYVKPWIFVNFGLHVTLAPRFWR